MATISKSIVRVGAVSIFPTCISRSINIQFGFLTSLVVHHPVQQKTRILKRLGRKIVPHLRHNETPLVHREGEIARVELHNAAVIGHVPKRDLQRLDILRNRGLATPEARTRALVRQANVLVAQGNAAAAKLAAIACHIGDGVATEADELVFGVGERVGSVGSNRDGLNGRLRHTGIVVAGVGDVVDDDAHGGLLQRYVDDLDV